MPCGLANRGLAGGTRRLSDYIRALPSQHCLIPKGSRLPAQGSEKFTTMHDNQTAILFQVLLATLICSNSPTKLGVREVMSLSDSSACRQQPLMGAFLHDKHQHS